ncbi:hypothetical protein MHB54_00175 [Paenibacillus sp. FSL M7-0802]|uniref:hypothetical protein n=1 Tax=Paenibacillus sp. FSL M7-0802 TaxID=2921536 RepID=UPI0030FB6C40
MGVFMSGTIFVNTEKRSVVSGSYVVSFHPKMSGKNITTINGKCYIDGYELVEGKWKRTFWSLWHRIF